VPGKLFSGENHSSSHILQLKVKSTAQPSSKTFLPATDYWEQQRLLSLSSTSTSGAKKLKV
jgi:hypothetical protein